MNPVDARRFGALGVGALGIGALVSCATSPSERASDDASSGDAAWAEAGASDAPPGDARATDAGVSLVDAGPCVLTARASPGSLQLPVRRTALVAEAKPSRPVLWSLVSGPTKATLHGVGTPEATAVGLRAGTYVFRADAGGCAPVDVTVVVAPAAPMPGTVLGQLQWSGPTYPKAGHTLPPLVNQICQLTSKAQFEAETLLVEKFGYAYHLHQADDYWNGLLDNPASDMRWKVDKNKSDPTRYRLVTTVNRPLYVWDEGRGEKLDAYLSKTLPGRCAGCSPSLLVAGSTPTAPLYSPAADLRFYDEIGKDVARGLAPYKARGIPLALALNLGEDDTGVSQGDCRGGKWSADPAIVADLKATFGLSATPACNASAWAQYASKRVAATQRRVTDAAKAALPAGALYVRYRVEGNVNRNRYGGWADWAPFYEDTAPASALPSMSVYFAGDEPPFFYWDSSKWDANADLLTGVLSSVAYQIKAGAPLSYNWVSAGWPTATDPKVSPIDRYVGFLKALYVAGNLGAVATWWSANPFGSGCDVTSPIAGGRMPDALAQLIALGEVHQLFTHLEAFLRDGDLVAGPASHRWTTSLPADRRVPAYELACTATACDRRLRVLARKRRSSAEWLIVAWATSGADADVSVDIAGLGTLTLRARAAGSVYLATPSGSGPIVTLLDEDPLRPTDTLLP